MRQRAHEPLEIAAALRHAVIHIETRAGRRKQHDLARVRAGVRELDGARHRVAGRVDILLREPCRAGGVAEPQRRVADEDERVDALLDERHEVREVRHLVIAAREQDDVLERLERLDRRVRVRRFRIVYITP